MNGEIDRGEIYYIVSGYQEEGSEQRAGRPAIIVSNNSCNRHSSVVEIVYLTTRPKTDLPTHIDIRSSERPSIALCEQVCSVSVDRIGEYVATCTKYEMDMINAALMISLGIEPDASGKKNSADEVVKKDAGVVKDVTDELTKTRAERDTYKALYDGLLDKVIGGKVAI